MWWHATDYFVWKLVISMVVCNLDFHKENEADLQNISTICNGHLAYSLNQIIKITHCKDFIRLRLWWIKSFFHTSTWIKDFNRILKSNKSCLFPALFSWLNIKILFVMENIDFIENSRYGVVVVLINCFHGPLGNLSAMAAAYKRPPARKITRSNIIN